MLDQSTPNIMTPNHLWGDWPKAPLQPLCIFKICRGCTNCRGGLCHSVTNFLARFSSPVGEGWKTLTVGHCLKHFRQFKEKHWPCTFAILAPRLYNSYNHAHVPGQHMWPSPGPGPDSKCSKTVEVRC